MAAISGNKLASIANAALDYYLQRGEVISQTLEDKPLLRMMDAKAKTFPGGKGNVSLAVKGTYTTTLAGYEHTDQVSYAEPDNLLRVNYPWKEHHAGITISFTELKHDGITVSDSATGENTSNHSGRDKHVLVNILQDKLEDMVEGYQRGMNDILFGDGTANSGKVFAGIQAIIKDDPTTGNVGGLLQTDASGNTWWRNRKTIDLATTATGQELTDHLHQEMRQLRRFGGSPDIAVCGSAFLDRLVTELKNKGNYTQTGWSSSGATDISVADISYGGLKFLYEPKLDSLTISGAEPTKRCYIIDSSKLYLHYMTGEKMKRHSPARPHDYYSIYRAITTTVTLCASQLNCHGVYEIA